MTKERKDPVLVVLQLTGGNDYFNTVIPLQRRPTTTTAARRSAIPRKRSSGWTTRSGSTRPWAP